MVNKEKIEQAVRLLLEGIGEDCDREGLRQTPERVARMYEEIFAGMDQSAKEHLSKTFTAENNEMIVEKDISFYSTCEHHLMPFYGKVHIAYIPDGKVVGISKLAQAEHMCMTMRGVKKPGSQTVTMVARGLLKENENLQNLFLNFVGR